ncbi:MAG TPA: pyridoxamine 5'-phosphate oxidase family protein [Acidimicrobiales bacterium]|nr:pyridoxamine 5'-phosphate oxidase family protein [Acidimicrobiales bacterium]
MHETEDDLAALDDLLERSWDGAGPHLKSIITAPRRMTARQIAEALDGMCLLALATVTADGRPLVGPVDGVFYRGRFHFGSSPDSVRFRHIRRRPRVSATHLPGEQMAVTVHGTAVPVDLSAPREAGLRRALLDVYVPRYGEGWERWLDNGPVYARIEPETMFSFFDPTLA